MHRPPSLATLALCIAALLVLVSCTGEEARPEGTARLFLRAIAAADAEEVYRLVAPASRQRLEALARLATDQTGGRKKIKPQDLLIAGMNQLPSAKPLVVEQQPKIMGDSAAVRLLDQKGKVRFVFEMVRAERRWRVLLPPKLLRTPEAVDPPTSQPASRPAP